MEKKQIKKGRKRINISYLVVRYDKDQSCPGDFASSLNRKPQAYARRIILIILQCENKSLKERKIERKGKEKKKRTTIRGFEAR